MRVDYSDRFLKELKKAPGKIKISFRDRAEMFTKDSHAGTLSNHALKGKFLDFRSINITGDWRAIYQELDGGKTVYFVALGTHSQLYR